MNPLLKKIESNNSEDYNNSFESRRNSVERIRIVSHDNSHNDSHNDSHGDSYDDSYDDYDDSY